MVLKIEKDHQRFRQIVKGRIREDLRKFLTKGELIGKEGKHLISIPVRGIELPTSATATTRRESAPAMAKKATSSAKASPARAKARAAPKPAITSWKWI